MTVNDIIVNKPYLAWDVKSPENLSEESVLERVLNFGNWDDVQQFIAIKGKNQTASVFKNTLTKTRTNYTPEIRSFFIRYFSVGNE